MNELFMQKMIQKEEKNAYGQEVSRYIGTFIKFSLNCKQLAPGERHKALIEFL